MVGDAARLVGQPPVLEIRGRIDSTVKIRGFKARSDIKKLGGVANSRNMIFCQAKDGHLICLTKPQFNQVWIFIICSQCRKEHGGLTYLPKTGVQLKIGGLTTKWGVTSQETGGKNLHRFLNVAQKKLGVQVGKELGA